MATVRKVEDVWPSITRDERIQHEILFYSQGPFDGYLIGERARDLFLHSRLPLTVLSQIWNLADVSNDNLLNVEEFVLAMHLIQGVLHGKKVPRILPHNLKPKSSTTVQLPPLTESEQEAYLKVFQSCDTARAGFVEATDAKELLQASELPAEQLADVWDRSDLNRDGKLDVEEWTVACQLVRLLKQGHSLEGNVNSFTYAPGRIAPTSLQARKLRVDEYDRHKHRLMTIKEKRKVQAVTETRRLQLLKEKSSLEKELYNKLSRLGKSPVSDAELDKLSTADVKEIDKLEEIVARLKKEHERIRQETVKVILGEQKLQGELEVIRSETAEINRRLATLHSKATKDADPFHQLYEQRKEERKKSNLSEGEEPEVHQPFKLSPFDKDAIDNQHIISGTDIFINCHITDNNNTKRSKENQSIIEDLHHFGDKFIEQWSSVASKKSPQRRESSSAAMEDEEDTVFMTVREDADEELWSSLGWMPDDQAAAEDNELVELHKKLVDLKNEMKKLNKDAGGKLVFRNPSDYLARKKAKEEEEQDKPRYPRRSKSSVDPDYVNKRRSYVERRNEEVADSLAREKRANRRSLNIDHKLTTSSDGKTSPRKPAPERPKKLPVRTNSTETESQIPVAPGRSRRSRNSAVLGDTGVTKSSPPLSPRKSTSPTTSPTRSAKKHRAPSPPVASPSQEEAATTAIAVPQSEKATSPERPPRRRSKHNNSSSSPESTSQVPSQNSCDSSLSKHCDTNSADIQEPVLEATTKSVLNTRPPLVNGEVTIINVSKDIILPSEKPPEKGHLGIDQIVNLSYDSDSQTKVEHTTNIKLSSKNQQNLHPAETNHTLNLVIGTETTLTKKPDIKSKPKYLQNGDIDFEHFDKKTLVGVEEPPLESNSQSKEHEFDEILEDVVVPVKTAKRAPDTVSLTESVQSETDSIPPELPVSPPPILPAGGHPIDSPVEEEVIEVVTSPVIENVPFVPSVDEEVIQINSSYKVKSKPLELVHQKEEEPPAVEEEIVQVITKSRSENQPSSVVVEKPREVTSPTVADLRAQFFGITRSPPPKMESSLLDEPLPKTNGAIDVYFNDLTLEAKQAQQQKDEDVDSDLSDTEQKNGPSFETTFTPSEAKGGNLPTAVADDDEADDGGIQLISFNTTSNSSMLQSPGEQSQTDSAFDEMMSSMHSNDLDRDISNQVSLSNTLEDFSDEPLVQIMETNSETIKRTENPPELEEEEEIVTEIIEVNVEVPAESAPEIVEVDEDIPTEYAPEPPQTSPPAPVFVQEENDDDDDYEEPVMSLPETPRPFTTRTMSPPLSTPGGPRDTDHIVKKAKNFSDIINEPPKITVKASTKEVSEERLHMMDRERKAIIQQSMRGGTFDGSMSSSEEEDEGKEEEKDVEITEEPIQKEDDNTKSGPTLGVTSGELWTKTSEAEDTADVQTRKVTFGTKVNLEDKPAKVYLYNDNIIQESETTASVDRDSIADLSSTRKQWETLFKAPVHNAGVPKPKPAPSTVRHWEVKLPYKPVSKPAASSTGDEMEGENNMYENESAIDREIRLANEREEMLRREQEERMELLKRQEASKQQVQKLNFEKQNNNNEFKAMYHEMTEADRGSEMQKREILIKQELDEQEEREKALSNGKESASEESDAIEEADNSTESIIAREIRLQQEREKELAKQNKQKTSIQEMPKTSIQEMPKQSPPQNSTPPKEISYEEAIGTYQHAGESLIARELREAKERDEELRKMRESIKKVDNSKGASVAKQDANKQNSNPKEKPVVKQEMNKQISLPKSTDPVKKLSPNLGSPSVHSDASSHTPVKNVTVTPILDSEQDNEDTESSPSQPLNETPIMREIRLARERENELRRQKGLPEIVDKPKKSVPVKKSYDSEPQESTPRSYQRQRSEKSASLKQYASSRLQNEIMKQRERELSLRQEGKILSTSEDHIEPMKYVEIASNVPVKRNFVTRRSVTTLSDSEQTPSEHSDSDSLKDVPINHTPPQPTQSKEEPKFRRTFTSGGPTFSYRESHQKAESKIEKELREMKEREEELRKQRAEAASQSQANQK